MTLDSEVVRVRSEEIQESLDRLRALAGWPVERFLGDRDAIDIACYRLLVAIEAALALCYHVSARHLRRVPEDYAACFALLGEAAVVSSDLAERLQRMARFRNLLVHAYGKLDHARVHLIIREDLGDLEAFRVAVVALL